MNIVNILKSNNHPNLLLYNKLINNDFINYMNSIYTVNDNNRNIIVKLSSGSDVSINLTQGSYTFNELGDHLISTLNGHGSLSGFSIVKDTKTLKYTINNSTSIE